MGQLIACAVPEGVVVASDSRAVFFEADGEERFINVNRIVKVAPHALLASAGAVEAQSLARDFAAFAKGENLNDIDTLIEAAVPYFTGRVDDFLRRACEKLPLDPVINLYLLLAGHSPQGPRLFLIWDRVQPPKIESNRVTQVFTLPRRMGLEVKLNQLVTAKASLKAAVAQVKAGMEKLAAQDEFVGPPFRYYTITAAGVQEA